MVWPLAGPAVRLGSPFHLIEEMHRRGSDDDYPDFDVNRLMDYLTRGLWPFLVQLLVLLPLAVFVFLGVFVVFFAVLSAVTQETAAVLVALVLVVMVLFLVGIAAVLLPLLILPMVLRAGLTEDFSAAFSWDFIRDFTGKTWKEIVLADLFVFAAGRVLFPAGAAVMGVGGYAVAALLAFVQHHLWYQIYELYLQRGGTPIPFRTARPGAAAGVSAAVR